MSLPTQDRQVQLSIGKYRGLQQCASARGIFVILAVDHRQNLRRAHPRFEEAEELTRFKLEVTQELAPFATGVLLDPEYGAAPAIAAGALPGDRGLVIALEATGYVGEPTARRSRLLEGWSVEKARRMGAQMAKLLVYYHPDSPTAAETEALVAETAAACQRYDLALMIEPLTYHPQGGERSAEEKRWAVIETARRLTAISGVDLLKAEFPLPPESPEAEWIAACRELDAASRVPWIVLSAAVDFETYLRQTIVACQAGASGIAVGRAVWQEAIHLHGEARREFLRTTARERMARLRSLCEALAQPFTTRLRTEVPPEWYQAYPSF